MEPGLLCARVIPPPSIRKRRDLTRARLTLIEHRATEANRVQQRIETATSTPGSIAADVLGVSGRLMLKARIARERDGTRLIDAKDPLRKKRQALNSPAPSGGRMT